MKIDNVSRLTTPDRVDQGKTSDKAGAAKVGATGQSGGAGSVTHLSQHGNDGSQDIDQARVDELRQAISEGRLEIHTDRIADALIANVKDWLEGQ